MRFFLLLLITAVTAGCGILTVPAVQRLSPDDQAQVDRMWCNLLSPTNRLDRELMLDVVLAFQLHQTGVERLKFTSEKDYSGGSVVMTIDFDRRKPVDEDRFAIDIRDSSGKLLRHEVYSGAEVLSHAGQLSGAGDLSKAFSASRVVAATMPGEPSTEQAVPELNDRTSREAWRKARFMQIIAATQPARMD